MRAARRNLTVMDGIVLVAATAAGLTITRHYYDVIGELPGIELHRGMSLMQVWYWAYHRGCMLQVSSIILSLTLLALRLRQPRPRFRRLMRQPGTVACWAILLVVLLRLLGMVEGALLARAVGLRWHQIVFDVDEIDRAYSLPLVFTGAADLAPQMCLAVAVSWALLLVGGQWRAEPSWIDRMGRVLGTYYILMIPFFFWFFPFSIDAR